MEDIDALLAEVPPASIEVGANAGQAEPTPEYVAFTETRKEFGRMQMRPEDKVRCENPQLFDSGSFLTSDSWVLDSRCGLGLTCDGAKVVEKNPDTGYMFTFAQESKHSNTHIGTVKVYLHGLSGIRPFLFENIALVPQASSNIFSEFWLKQGGY